MTTFSITTISLLCVLAISVDAHLPHPHPVARPHRGVRAPAGAVVDVTKFGAKPNCDISQAFLAAWKSACESPTPKKVLIPSGTYVLGQVKLCGPCKAPIQVVVNGILKAPMNVNSFKEEGTWVVFEHIDGFTLSGRGVFDGQGELAWKQNDCHKNQKCKSLPISLRFNFVCNAVVRGITSLNSKNFHVNVLGCNNLTFDHFTVTAPGSSRNTDGIHIGRSNGVNIIDTNIKTGDDCISMGDGSKNINITRVTCGPGHGISIGSLGKYQNEEPVSGIRVTNCTISNTDNGVRIKTWPASYPGVASDMHFKDIIVNNVTNPVIVDQGYCPWNQCNAQVPSKVKLSNISFKNIRGTSGSAVAVKLACSPGFPCQNVQIGDINLSYTGREGPVKSECSNVKPVFIGKQFPPVCRA